MIQPQSAQSQSAQSQSAQSYSAQGRPTLSLPQVLAFAGIAVPLAAIGLPFAVYMPRFYAGDVGLGLETTGAIFMSLRFWDIATDPLMGYLVDRRPSRWGRIKHWLVLSVPILMVSAWFIYVPGGGLADGGDITPLYLVGWLVVFYIGFTMLQTPHQAWVPTLAASYDERSRLFQWREIISTASLLSLLILPDLLARFAGYDRGQQIMVMGLILLVSLPVTIGVALALVPDRTAPVPSHATADFSRNALSVALRNGALWRILIIEVAIGIAIASTAATYLFAAEWGFGVVQGASAILMLFFLAGFSAIPFWMWVARKTQKHVTVTIISLFAAFAYLSYLPLSGYGGFELLMIGAILSGLAFGSPFIMVRSMMADLVEVELARTGANRAGLYYSLMTSAYKTGASLAVGVPFIMLGVVIGFDPIGENSPEAIRGLMWTFVGVPGVSYLIAAVAAWGYPVTRAVQSQASADLAARGGDGADDGS
ncbi:MAG: MFS transporter [Alphaproteobacteria bacterium]